MSGFIKFNFIILSIFIFELNGLLGFHNEYMTFYNPREMGRSGKPSRRYIALEGKYSYSVQLILHSAEERDEQWLTRNETNPVAEFIIKGPEYSYYAVMAIIQSVHLRTDPLRPGHCSDFMKFIGSSDSNVEADATEPICGSLQRDEDYMGPGVQLLGPRSYFNPNGSIKLQVHLSASQENIDQIGAQIVFTAYTTCPPSDVGLKTLKTCSSSESLACIPTPLFCDSKIDCGFPGEFGVDEEYCYFPYLYAGGAVLLIVIVILTIHLFMRWVRIKAKKGASNANNVGPVTSGTTAGGGQGDCIADMASPDMAFDMSCSF